MGDLLSTLLNDSLTLIAILNPFGNIPLFIAMTEDMKEKTRKKTFDVIVFSGFGIILSFGLIGHFLMSNFFKIEMKEVRIAGGILLVTVALKNILFQKKPKKVLTEDDGSEEDDIKLGITPMAFPMLVGPGSMATIMIIRQQSGVLVSVLSTIIVFSIIKLLLKFTDAIEDIFGKLVLFVLSRVMQLFIMAIGIRIFITGIIEVIQNIGG
jgi:multiple antibiotic resistance protein